jgi:hypothetical protein
VSFIEHDLRRSTGILSTRRDDNAQRRDAQEMARPNASNAADLVDAFTPPDENGHWRSRFRLTELNIASHILSPGPTAKKAQKPWMK